MVFQLTARLSICSDIADDPVEVAHLTKLFWNAENNNTEWSILFPWIYRKTRQARMDAVMELYHKISARVDARRLADVKKEDSLQVLIDAGDSTHDIVEVCTSFMKLIRWTCADVLLAVLNERSFRWRRSVSFLSLPRI